MAITVTDYLELVDSFPTEVAAREAFAALKEQEGFCGGVVRALPSGTNWVISAFFEKPSDLFPSLLPKAVYVVSVPSYLKEYFGIIK